MREVLRLTNVHRAFNGTTVLREVTLDVRPGDRLAVLGPSGSGKTTLLRIIAGLEVPTTGEVVIDGRLASRGGELLVAPEHRQIALVFQGLALFPHLRALDQIAFAARGRGGVEHARTLLDRVGLGHRATARLDELSGGERQRIALARALAQQPRLLLMDEPFASLDDEKRLEMRDLLRSLISGSQTTLIMVTHFHDDALDLARTVLVLNRGKPAAHGPLETILTAPRHSAAARSLGLGQIIEGEFSAGGEIQTAFGKVRGSALRGNGRVQLLVRPGQPEIVTIEQGVEAEIVSLELRPPELRELRRVAVVRVGNSLLRVQARNMPLSVGDRVRIQIRGDCEVIAAD